MADKLAGRKWEDMELDVLVKIFKLLNLTELSPVSLVCRSWLLACSDPLIWNTFDLGLLKSNFIKTRVSPYVWVDGRSDARLTRVLRVAMGLSRGNVTCLVFHFNLYMKDSHLSIIAERCPHLKRLVLPAWNYITKPGICEAIRRWEDLESLTMPGIGHPPYIMEAISRSCKNFSELKIMGQFDILFASAIAYNLPKLKVLSLRCTMLFREALLYILENFESLEVLNISHCMLVDVCPSLDPKKTITQMDHTIIEKASRLREFIYCCEVPCILCERTIADEGLMRWYKYETGLWREDEVRSLSLGDYGKLLDDSCIQIVDRT
ncbi:F-box/LRR-repeat protein [Acorus calamus]|uniref:F-box/LRR-repeat protein n=1 Tax=Acorus calamus TaxID=4465 RepID=A0AAV9CPZ3_ACOCL|nr:F-box/LRR-repeat protein [Acorus calamus]